MPEVTPSHEKRGAGAPKGAAAAEARADVAQRLIFEHAVEGLFQRGLAGRVTPALKAQLREAGVDLERPLLPAYPWEVWARCVGMAARALHPEEPDTVGWRLVGERMVDGYRETLVGGAMFGMLRLLGPKRMVGRTRQNFRSGNNYTEARITEVGPGAVDLWMNEVGPLRYFTQGAVLAGMRGAGAEDVRVEVSHFDDAGVTFRVTWGAPGR
jgi:uncharacterized protein (TIGR02265 family)